MNQARYDKNSTRPPANKVIYTALLELSPSENEKGKQHIIHAEIQKTDVPNQPELKPKIKANKPQNNKTVSFEPRSHSVFLTKTDMYDTEDDDNFMFVTKTNNVSDTDNDSDSTDEESLSFSLSGLPLCYCPDCAGIRSHYGSR